LFAGGVSHRVTTKWYKNNIEITNEYNQMQIWQTIIANSNYGLMVYNDNIIEYDEIALTIEDTATVVFGLSYLADSTAYFSNYTQGANPKTTSYFWDFGDGTTSTSINPTHTFPAMDSSYRVCLKVNHTCGVWQYCDTVFVDTIVAGFYSKKGNNTDPYNWQAPVNNSLPTLQYKNVLGNNYPNPFNGQTQIDYELMPTCNNAKIVLSNQIGQVVKTINLYGVKGTINLEKGYLQAGMYYYSLVVNEIQVANKIMVIK